MTTPTATEFEFWTSTSAMPLEVFLRQHAGKRFNLYTKFGVHVNVYAWTTENSHHIKGRKYRGRRTWHLAHAENVETVCIQTCTFPYSYISR